MLQNNLGAAQYMARWCHANLHITKLHRLAIAKRCLYCSKIIAIARSHNSQRFGGGDHLMMAGTGMIGMAMGDKGCLARR